MTGRVIDVEKVRAFAAVLPKGFADALGVVLDEHEVEMGDVERAATVLRPYLDPLASDADVTALTRRVLAAGWLPMAREIERLRQIAGEAPRSTDG